MRLSGLLCLELPFVKLIVLDVLLTGLSILLEFAALVFLRIREPYLSRPFRVPGGLWGAVAIGVPPLAFLVLTVLRTPGRTGGTHRRAPIGRAPDRLGRGNVPGGGKAFAGRQTRYRRLIRLATYPAPKPLSIFTTVTLLEQLLSIPSRAASP